MPLLPVAALQLVAVELAHPVVHPLDDIDERREAVLGAKLGTGQLTHLLGQLTHLLGQGVEPGVGAALGGGKLAHLLDEGVEAGLGATLGLGQPSHLLLGATLGLGQGVHTLGERRQGGSKVRLVAEDGPAERTSLFGLLLQEPDQRVEVNCH